MVPTIYGREDSNEHGETIAAAVAVGLPTAARPLAGVVYVWSGKGSEDDARKHVQDMVDQGMGVRGVEHYETKIISGDILVDSDQWASVVAVAFFCDRDIEAVFRPSDLVDDLTEE